MKSTVATFRVLAGLAGCCLAGTAVAGDLGSTAASKGAQVPSKIDQEINQAVGSNNSAASADVDERIRDLDATRTAIDQKKPPTVSLSVSGWVTQEVQYNVKQ